MLTTVVNELFGARFHAPISELYATQFVRTHDRLLTFRLLQPIVGQRTATRFLATKQRRIFFRQKVGHRKLIFDDIDQIDRDALSFAGRKPERVRCLATIRQVLRFDFNVQSLQQIARVHRSSVWIRIPRLLFDRKHRKFEEIFHPGRQVAADVVVFDRVLARESGVGIVKRFVAEYLDSAVLPFRFEATFFLPVERRNESEMMKKMQKAIYRFVRPNQIKKKKRRGSKREKAKKKKWLQMLLT